jgi:predicted acetyltransferase
MSVDYRIVNADDIEQLVEVEATAFYGTATPDRIEMQRNLIPPDWTVAAFVDGRLVASVRTIPMVRRMNGSKCGFGAIGPVACLSAYRRQGHVGRLLRLALERSRDSRQPLSGLYTPHDALYARFGWERAEGRRRYQFNPKDVRLRQRGARGRLDAVTPDDWERLHRIFSGWAELRNGPLLRNEVWWTQAIMVNRDATGTRPHSGYVWVSESGEDQGYILYSNFPMAPDGRWAPQEIIVFDFVTLSSDAYLGLWDHLTTHDLARRITVELSPDDPFRDLVEDPFRVDVTAGEGAMLRIADVESAIERRGYIGERPVSFSMRISDRSAPWNEDTWLVEAAEGQMRATRKDTPPDVELSANTLAPLYTGHMRADVAASVGLLKVNRPEAVSEMARAFAVFYPPYCNDNY